MSNPSTPGWHPHPTRRGKYGYFNGRDWDAEVRDAPPSSKPTSSRAASRSRSKRTQAADLIAIGVLVALGAGALGAVLRDNDVLSSLVLGVGGAVATILILIGCIGEGVRLGTAAADDERRNA